MKRNRKSCFFPSKKVVLMGILIPAFILMGCTAQHRKQGKGLYFNTEKGYVPTGEYCSMEDLGEMDYYLFCHTEMSSDVGPVEYASVVIDSQTQTVEEAKALYQEFKERLPLEEEEEENGEQDGDEGEETEISYVSSDCKWIVTQKWSEHQTMNTQILFHEKEKVKEKICEASEGVDPILLVKKEDTYQEMEEGQYKKLLDIKREKGYRKINAEGELYARTNVDDSLLTIGAVKDGTDQWSYDLAKIKEKAREIRESKGHEEDSVIGVFIEQFEGNEQEGWLVVQAGPSSFFRIAYPSGEVTYLGEYLYSPCFSPDGKYLAYSGIDYDNVVGMDLEEEKGIPPLGIYIREVETGKTAYIAWDRLSENRSFIWLKKECFEEYMGKAEKESSDHDTADQRGQFDKYGEQYSLIEIKDGEYEVTLYDKENKVVHTETFTKLPWVSEMTDDILQIGLSLGSPAPYIYYYDKERAIVSTCYPDSFYLKDNYVAYMRDVSTLIVTDIFEDNELYMEISRNFSDSRNLGGLYLAIKDITWITLTGRDVLVLEYHEGEDRELLTEVIPIENGEEAVAYNDLDELEKEYDILEYDICAPVLHDFENVHPTIKAHAEYEMQNHGEICQKYGKQLKISLDYHTFDFDDDGLDDYLLCVDRELYDGKVEHWIEIYVTKRQRGYVFATQKMEDEIVSSVLKVNLPQTDQIEDDGHKQIVVLNEKTEGYYDIVLPWSNLILKYDAWDNRYEFCDQ